MIADSLARAAVAIANGVGDSVVDALLELRALCFAHFTHEEALMEASRYDDGGAHMRAHAQDIAYLDGIIQRAAATSWRPDQGAMDLLGMWLREHIRTMDMDLAEAVRRHRRRHHA